MPKPIIVTTSWDDGDSRDLRIAEMLRSREIGGTFYIPIQSYRTPSLSHAELRALSSEGFEIGAHSVSHKHLWKLSVKELTAEINPCKPILEDIIGSEVRMFCYPRGRYDANTLKIVKQAGYAGGRTCRLLATGTGFDPFEMPTTVEAIPNPPLSYFKNALRARTMDGLESAMAQITRLGDWVELGKHLFDTVLQNGGVWHLWGHSWMIDEQNLWKDLEEMLDYVSKRDGVTYLPNWKLLPLSCAQATNSTQTYQENWSL
jgi:peptidoglycan/xylan/chitin deacetylase (PgdA/CDA1 family)